MAEQTVILGGGISGLSMAYFLQQQGKNVVVLEKNEHTGGAIQTNISNGFVCEAGPNTVLINNAPIAQLLIDLKLLDECIFANKSSNKRYLFHNNRMIALPGTPGQFIRSPLLTPLQKMRALLEPMVPRHAAKATPSIEAFICRRFGRGIYDKFVVPFITGIYAGDPANMSVRHALKQLYEAEQQYGSVLYGFPKHLKKRNARLSELGVPAGALFTFRNGMQQLITTLQNALGDAVKCNAEVNQLTETGNDVLIQYRQHGVTHEINANEVVSTLPAHAAAQLLSSFDQSLSQHLNAIDYAPMAVLHLGFKQEALKHLSPGFGVLTLANSQHHFLGSIFSSIMFPHTAPEGMALFTVFMGGQRQPEIVELDDETLTQLLLPEIQALLGTEQRAEFIRIQRWKSAIPQYGLHHPSLLDATARFHAAHPHIHLSGNYLNGVSVSDCIANASYLATELAKR